jgi:hypothetical protein
MLAFNLQNLTIFHPQYMFLPSLTTVIVAAFFLPVLLITLRPLLYPFTQHPYSLYKRVGKPLWLSMPPGIFSRTWTVDQFVQQGYDEVR